MLASLEAIRTAGEASRDDSNPTPASFIPLSRPQFPGARAEARDAARGVAPPTPHGGPPPRYSFRFRGRNFLALVLKPETPRAAWLADLDQWLARSPGFFTGKPLILDLAGLGFARSDIVALMAELESRAIRIIGIEGADPSILDKSLPPLLTGGRTA